MAFSSAWRAAIIWLESGLKRLPRLRVRVVTPFACEVRTNGSCAVNASKCITHTSVVSCTSRLANINPADFTRTGNGYAFSLRNPGADGLVAHSGLVQYGLPVQDGIPKQALVAPIQVAMHWIEVESQHAAASHRHIQNSRAPNEARLT